MASWEWIEVFSKKENTATRGLLKTFMTASAQRLYMNAEDFYKNLLHDNMNQQALAKLLFLV